MRGKPTGRSSRDLLASLSHAGDADGTRPLTKSKSQLGPPMPLRWLRTRASPILAILRSIVVRNGFDRQKMTFSETWTFGGPAQPSQAAEQSCQYATFQHLFLGPGACSKPDGLPSRER